MRYDSKKIEQMKKDMKFDIDEAFAAKISSIKIDKKDPWGKAIRKACFTEKWYSRLWEWIKGLFGHKIKKTLTRPMEVEMNKDFDFQEWVIARRDKIIKAIKKDGKDKNTITCPICYKDRKHSLVPTDKQIHSLCAGCGINITRFGTR